MATKKLIIKATEEQLDELYKALKAGTPIHLALQYARISRATFYYWVAMANVAEQVKSQKELEQMEEITKSGISLQDIRDLSESDAPTRRTAVGAFIEPSQETILQYKNNRKFRKFADQCYEIVCECNKLRSQVAISNLTAIALSKDKKNRINPSGAMWFLERNFSDYFAKASEKGAETEKDQVVEPIKVNFIDPDSKETQERVREMEEDIINSYKEGGHA